MKRLLRTILPPFAVQLAVLLAWYLSGKYELVPTTLLVPPERVWETAKDMWSTGELQTHVGWSLRRVFLGYLIGSGAGIVLGAAVGISRRAQVWLGPTLDIFKQVPVFAWAPMMMLFFGIEEASKLAFVAVACFYPVLLNTSLGVQSVQSRHREVGEAFGLSRTRIFLRIVVPSAVPSVLVGLRQSIALAWMALVSAELLGAESGIGYFMTYSRLLFQMDGVIVGVLAVGAIGILTNALLDGLERWLVPWTKEVA